MEVTVDHTNIPHGNSSREIDTRHLPPHHLEAERSVIGALLLDQAAFHKVLEVGLEPEDFYKEANSLIFDSIRALHASGEPVDTVTLTDSLKNKGILEKVGGLTYVTSIFDDSYSSAHVTHYSKIVKEKAILRRMISTANDLVTRAYDGVEDISEFLDLAEKSIFDVTDTKIHNSFTNIKQIMLDNMHTIQELSEKKTTITGLPTGFKDLDYKTSGLHAGQLIVIAARPAMGKTSFALNIAENAAISASASVAVFSLEMSKEELGVRFLTSLAKIDASRLKVGRLQERDWKALAKASKELSETKLFIDDTPALSVLELRTRCRRLQAEHGLGLVIVDYLQLMRGLSKGGKAMDSREREISDISRSLKALAKELKVPVVALSQLNRSLEGRPDKRPMLSDLRESGAIEQDADIVVFIYRDEVYNGDSPEKGTAEIIVAKHRSGSVGTIRLGWQSEITAFSNLASDNQYPAGAYYNSPPAIQNNNFEEYSDELPPLPEEIQATPRKGKLDLPNF